MKMDTILTGHPNCVTLTNDLGRAFEGSALSGQSDEPHGESGAMNTGKSLLLTSMFPQHEVAIGSYYG